MPHGAYLRFRLVRQPAPAPPTDASSRVGSSKSRALVSLCGGAWPPQETPMKTISWNRRAVEQAKAQGVEPLHAVCPECGTKPAQRQFGRYQCECGELEGFESG